jgi:predicted NAD/FAD-dependent oxidoreductase
MATPPRIAVVGGGIAGTLCSLVLRNRGLSPLLIDAGKHGVGGRLRGGRREGDDGGAQFLRATDPRLAAVMFMLEQEGLVARWKGRFGILGSAGGGFLSSEVVGTSLGFTRKQQDESSSKTSSRSNASDGGDFCGFVNENRSDVPTYVGMPSMLELCPGICQKAGIDVFLDSRVLAAETVEGGGWRLKTEGAGNHSDEDVYDGLVLATHDPSLASSTVKSIASKEDSSGGEASLSARLFNLAEALQTIRDSGKMPVCTLSATYPRGFSNNILFDAVSVHGSSMIQFLARDASKPGRRSSDTDDDGGLWTAVSTSQFANDMLKNGVSSRDAAEEILSEELSRLFAPSFGGNVSLVPKPQLISTKLWRAGFNSSSLDLLEDSVALAPWRLAIGGEYISKLSAHPTPIEAAAISGLEAGERVAAFFQTTE